MPHTPSDPPAAGASRGAALRRLASEGTFAVPGAPIALAAKLIEREGFGAIYLSGAAFSAGLLGVPDIGILTLDQLVSQTQLLAAAVEIPLIVDADTGFGGPVEVIDCVRKLEAAGAAAIQLEDQRRPKRCGHLPGKEIVETAEMCAKIAAARAALRDPTTVIIGRSDARGVTNLDDCIGRLEAYRDSGADWLFPEALVNRDEFARVGRQLSGTPLVANMTEFGTSPLFTLDELSDLGFSAVIYPVTLLRLAMKAIEAGLGLIADERSQTGLLDLMQARDELHDQLDYDPRHPERHLPPTPAS